MNNDLAWLRSEAERLGLALDDDDLRAIAEQLERTRAGLAAATRDLDLARLEPPYRFEPGAHPDNTEDEP